MKLNQRASNAGFNFRINYTTRNESPEKVKEWTNL